jgi:hypothetical protein
MIQLVVSVNSNQFTVMKGDTIRDRGGGVMPVCWPRMAADGVVMIAEM